MKRKVLRFAAAMFAVLLLCPLSSCAEQRESIYFLSGNNMLGEAAVYRCDGEKYYELWSQADGEIYARCIDGDTLYYAPYYSAEGSELRSVNLKTGENKTVGKIPDGTVRQLAVGKAGVYFLLNFSSENDNGIYLMQGSEPKRVADANIYFGNFVCYDGGVYYFANSLSGIMRYDEKSGITQEIVGNEYEDDIKYIACDGDSVFWMLFRTEPNTNRYPKTVVNAYFAQYNMKTGESQTFAIDYPDSPFWVNDGWIYSTRRINTPFEGWEGPNGSLDFFARRSLKTQKDEILGPMLVTGGDLSTYKNLTFGQKGFVFSGYVFSEEDLTGGHPVYYYYPYGATKCVELSLAEYSDEAHG